MTFLTSLLAAVPAQLATSLAWQAFAALFALFLALVVAELIRHRRIDRYLDASFATDVLYTVLIIGGVYAWVQQPLVNLVDGALRQHAPFLYLDLLRGAPEPLQLVLFLIAVDFCRYWKHRWLHAVPWLQAVHSIHHGAENLTFLTTYRMHFVEYILDGLITLLPVVLLGIPPAMWLPVYLGLIVLSALHHSDTDISFGWLNRIFVCPRFHATHHSADRTEFDSNYAAMFSVWDVLFGTANFRPTRPQRYGLPQLQMPRSFLGQLIFPARLIARRWKRRREPQATTAT
ncbi:sterol desaturase family protein [Bradyrhizobium sp. U87765 SZCCT0131]|uniref:sterol desaturase family protein n=1 Tax=unclassified Bradyrhizobium TaxID=2631580 RepID=UPI001BA86126|nr:MULTISPECIES: sterol desaturase family protein [unclassified Bradyrhizobium]MBR1223022.1 sterol desaturase family protein [Bradyrhizobium sp. U87765 SZCCT0131]MBR1262758.1 sterol desaturase family protein [Bradyrhizobium sp. U87765 SZCCT0134]MBR1308770.1 sterol desaturase family protein [Bradyrhizobium sp. U87765 SZCCT0110]MBR1318540.1 sterol desaturase family protein [Bradyrhizobium sp. U87765 SZCCT0109]MBR1352244.1 sterol desaturase family protein [Bradyrhizobium sp. U87765 SZCCT0048]